LWAEEEEPLLLLLPLLLFQGFRLRGWQYGLLGWRWWRWRRSSIVAPYGPRVDEGATQVLLLAQVYGGILGPSERASIASFACCWIGGKSMKTFRDAEENL
jgi:hypothetical protein